MVTWYMLFSQWDGALGKHGYFIVFFLNDEIN